MGLKPTNYEIQKSKIWQCGSSLTVLYIHILALNLDSVRHLFNS